MLSFCTWECLWLAVTSHQSQFISYSGGVPAEVASSPQFGKSVYVESTGCLRQLALVCWHSRPECDLDCQHVAVKQACVVSKVHVQQAHPHVD